jgi:sigma-B regulation protein RsbU (phosphoserine phosphatase)
VVNPPIVLVVDDEAFNVDYLFQELEDFGVTTISAKDGIEALEQVGRHSPDLVLLDIMMPKMDGFAVLAKMKSEETFRDIPIIIISANSDMQHVLKGIAMGAEDYLPKPFDPLLLRARVNASLEKKRFRNLEKEYLKGLERELEIGRQIQAGFLPKEIVSPQGWEISAFFRAAREVAGDFYDVFLLEDDRLALIVGDVTDKGVGAALYMALYRSLLRAYLSTSGFVKNGTKNGLSEAASFVNNYICRVHHSVMYLTAFMAILDPSSGKLAFVSAGHDFPLVVRRSGDIQELKPTGPAIGILEDRVFGLGEIQLEPGDTLLVYTDGLLDLRNSAGSSFGPNLRSLVGRKTNGIRVLIANIVSQADDFCAGTVQYDDITILGISRLT